MIKVLLLLALAGIALAGARLGDSPRDMAVKRLSVLAVFLAGSMAVLFPEAVTSVGQVIGVGRGTDLILYLLVVISALVWLGTYKRLARLDEQLTEIARAHALLDARGDASPSAGDEHRTPGA